MDERLVHYEYPAKNAEIVEYCWRLVSFLILIHIMVTRSGPSSMSRMISPAINRDVVRRTCGLEVLHLMHESIAAELRPRLESRIGSVAVQSSKALLQRIKAFHEVLR